VVDQPFEIVGYVTFDPADVTGMLPPELRFLTVSELAARGIPWAATFLAGHEDQASWGISFIELFRAKTFSIDGRQPEWGQDGAIALWFARVAPVDPSHAQLGPGTPLLVLDFSVPDSAYAAYMRARGYQAAYDSARLARNAEGTWRGSFRSSGASVTVTCTPTGPIGGGPESRGRQILIPPATSGGAAVVRIAFVGHREQQCREPTPWFLGGDGPLARGIVVEPSNVQFGYEMVGGTYVSGGR
jgi:hypothetical protein